MGNFGSITRRVALLLARNGLPAQPGTAGVAPAAFADAVKPDDCIHCGKEICNDLGWCNDYKAAGTAGVKGTDSSVPPSEPT